MAFTVDKYRITQTNYSNAGSRWNGVSVYDGPILIARVKTTAKYGSLNYIKDHPNSRYRKDLVQQLRDADVPEWVISAIVS